MTSRRQPDFAACLKQAEQLQQRAERHSGSPQALGLLQQTVAKYEEALSLAPPGSASGAAEAWFGLGESLQFLAEALLDAAAALPNGQASAAAERDAAAQATSLLERAVGAYQRVPDDDMPGQVRVDALVNCGNSLSKAAEVAAEAAQQVQLLERAEGCYRQALQKEDDALTWSNLADALVQRAEACCESGAAEAGANAYEAAQAAYTESCSRSDAADGDDLAGLLINWGRGLLSMAQHAQDPPLALRLLEDAARRLQQSVEFLRGDDAPFNALGDVLMERAGLLARGAAAGSGSAEGSAVAAARATLGEASAAYQSALRIQAQQPEALCGVADVHMQLARLATEPAAAAQEWATAAQALRAALQQPSKFTFSERCSTRYNLACALAQSGAQAEARQLLEQLVACGGVTADEARADVDLAPLW